MADLYLTAPQAKGLALLREHGPLSPREFAQLMWPDSPGWETRTRKFGGAQGAVGGTMPMKGARLLWRLHALGLASQDHTDRWRAHGGGEQS